jgi:muconolactone delta-isomerase
MFIVDARIVDNSNFERHLDDEKRAVAELRENGFIEQLYRRIDDTGAWLIVEADSRDAAARRLDELPFVRVGVMTMHLDEVERL